MSRCCSAVQAQGCHPIQTHVAGKKGRLPIKDSTSFGVILLSGKLKCKQKLFLHVVAYKNDEISR